MRGKLGIPHDRSHYSGHYLYNNENPHVPGYPVRKWNFYLGQLEGEVIKWRRKYFYTICEYCHISTHAFICVEEHESTVNEGEDSIDDEVDTSGKMNSIVSYVPIGIQCMCMRMEHSFWWETMFQYAGLLNLVKTK